MSAKTVPNEIAFTGTRDDMSFAGGTIRPVTGGSWVGEGQRAVDGTPERRGAFFSVGGLGDELNPDGAAGPGQARLVPVFCYARQKGRQSHSQGRFGGLVLLVLGACVVSG